MSKRVLWWKSGILVSIGLLKSHSCSKYVLTKKPCVDTGQLTRLSICQSAPKSVYVIIKWFNVLFSLRQSEIATILFLNNSVSLRKILWYRHITYSIKMYRLTKVIDFSLSSPSLMSRYNARHFWKWCKSYPKSKSRNSNYNMISGENSIHVCVNIMCVAQTVHVSLAIWPI